MKFSSKATDPAVANLVKVIQTIHPILMYSPTIAERIARRIALYNEGNKDDILH